MAKSKDQEFELSKFSDEELQAELERRAKDGDPLPKSLEKPDFKRLAKLVVEGVEEAHEEKYEDDTPGSQDPGQGKQGGPFRRIRSGRADLLTLPVWPSWEGASFVTRNKADSTSATGSTGPGGQASGRRTIRSPDRMCLRHPRPPL